MGEDSEPGPHELSAPSSRKAIQSLPVRLVLPVLPPDEPTVPRSVAAFIGEPNLMTRVSEGRAISDR